MINLKARPVSGFRIQREVPMQIVFRGVGNMAPLARRLILAGYDMLAYSHGLEKHRLLPVPGLQEGLDALEELAFF